MCNAITQYRLRQIDALLFLHLGQAQHQAHPLLCQQVWTTMPQQSRETQALGVDGLLRIDAAAAVCAASTPAPRPLLLRLL